MSKAAVLEQNYPEETAGFSRDQLDIIKKSICNGCTNEELKIFLMACQKTNLDPFMNQIYAVKRQGRMTIQTGIDGYRLIAERTGRYAPGQEPSYEVDEKGNLISSTAYIKKLTADGTWHTVSASAYFSEYCQQYNGKIGGMWGKMPRTMLAKCAEAQALRKAFPAEMSGVYTKEEMEQADNTLEVKPAPDIQAMISERQSEDFKAILDACDQEHRDKVYNFLKIKYKSSDLKDFPLEYYERAYQAAAANAEKNYLEKQKIKPVSSDLPEEEGPSVFEGVDNA